MSVFVDFGRVTAQLMQTDDAAVYPTQTKNGERMLNDASIEMVAKFGGELPLSISTRSHRQQATGLPRGISTGRIVENTPL